MAHFHALFDKLKLVTYPLVEGGLLVYKPIELGLL